MYSQAASVHVLEISASSSLLRPTSAGIEHSCIAWCGHLQPSGKTHGFSQNTGQREWTTDQHDSHVVEPVNTCRSCNAWACSQKRSASTAGTRNRSCEHPSGEACQLHAGSATPGQVYRNHISFYCQRPVPDHHKVDYSRFCSPPSHQIIRPCSNETPLKPGIWEGLFLQDPHVRRSSTAHASLQSAAD